VVSSETLNLRQSAITFFSPSFTVKLTARRFPTLRWRAKSDGDGASGITLSRNPSCIKEPDSGTCVNGKQGGAGLQACNAPGFFKLPALAAAGGRPKPTSDSPSYRDSAGQPAAIPDAPGFRECMSGNSDIPWHLARGGRGNWFAISRLPARVLFSRERNIRL